MQFTSTRLTDDRSVSALANQEAHLFRLSRPNVLLIGSGAHLDAAITAIVGRPASAVASWSSALDTAPSAWEETVIVRNVMTLDAAAQLRLNSWMDARTDGVRVIATTPEPIYPLVEARQFLEPLYYRLNVVCVDSADLERAGHLS